MVLLARMLSGFLTASLLRRSRSDTARSGAHCLRMCSVHGKSGSDRTNTGGITLCALVSGAHTCAVSVFAGLCGLALPLPDQHLLPPDRLRHLHGGGPA